MTEFCFPSDITKEEVNIIKHVFLDVYRQLEDPKEKLVVSLCYELGYGKQECAYALGITYETVWKIDNTLRERLKMAKEVKV